MTRISKAIIAALLAVSTWGVTAASDGSFDAVEWFGLLGAVATAIGTYAVPNTPPEGEAPRDDVSEMRV